MPLELALKSQNKKCVNYLRLSSKAVFLSYLKSTK